MRRPFTRASPLRSALDSAGALILYITLAVAPLPFGSTDPWVIAFWCSLLGLGVVLASTRPVEAAHIPPLTAVAIIVVSYTFVLHEQLAERPWLAEFNPIWTEASEMLKMHL